MAHNILLSDKKMKKAKLNNNILFYIKSLYDISQKLQKSYFIFLPFQNNQKKLQEISKVIKKIMQAMFDLESFKSVPLSINDLFNNLNFLQNKISFHANNANKTIFMPKELVELVIMLLSLHQIDIKKKKNAIFSVALKDKSLLIQTPLFSLEKKEKEALLSKNYNQFIEYKYKIYSLYINFLKLLEKNSFLTMQININKNNNYQITISIPIKNIAQNSFETQTFLHSLTKRVLLYSNSKYLANKIKEYLKNYNFTIDIQNDSSLPLLMNYHIVIIDEELLTNQILTLLEKNRFFDLKVLVLSETTKKLPYAITLKKPFSKETFLNTLLKLFIQQPQKTSKKVLIADDDIVNLRLLEYECKKYDLDVLTASNGKELLELLEKYGANLIILDSKMPLLDGFETATLIRKKKKFQKIPLIIHSSFSLDEKKSDIFHYGFDDYLPRPFSKKDLEKIIKRYITYPQENLNLKKKKRFYALYKDIDKLIDKYIQKKDKKALITLLLRLKESLYEIEEFQLIKDIELLEYFLQNQQEVHHLIFTKFLKKLTALLKQLKPLIE